VTTFAEVCARVVDHLIRHDEEAFDVAYAEFESRLPDADRLELTEAVEAVAGRLDDVGLADGQQAALIGAMLVEHGAPAAPLVRVAEPKVTGGMQWALNFPRGWDLASYGAALPDPDDDEVDVEDVLDQLQRNLERAAMTEEEADHLTEAWFSVGPWMQALLAGLQTTDGRGALAAKDELIAALEPIQEDYNEQFSTAYWLLGALLVLDDEPLIVLHRASGAGYRMTIGGVGDNYQLHTLLADRLIGDPGSGLIYDVRPQAAWVAAAEDGDDLEPEGGIKPQFTLIDAYGELILNQERPADIPELDGVRVVVLDRPQSTNSWNAGRLYSSMLPTVRLDEVMPAGEAAQWLHATADSKASATGDANA